MPAEEPLLPHSLGRFEIIDRLATGGMAEIFKAKVKGEAGFERTVVVKRILPHLAADPEFVGMIIDEARISARLIHPKIVQVLDFGQEAGQYFIAMEYVDGMDCLGMLRECALRRLRVPLPLSCHVVAELLDALDFAHNATDDSGQPLDIIHRDISPSNVFLSFRGDVKLGDFGIARAVDRQRQAETQAGTLKGKYGYMAPEQVLGARIDQRADLFSSGIVLAELLMGRRLFTAPADLDVLLMVRDARLDRLERYGRDIPPGLRQIVERSLRRDPDERFPSAGAFRDALQDFLFEQRLRVSSRELAAFLQGLRRGPDDLPAKPTSSPNVNNHAVVGSPSGKNPGLPQVAEQRAASPVPSPVPTNPRSLNPVSGGDRGQPFIAGPPSDPRAAAQAMDGPATQAQMRAEESRKRALVQAVREPEMLRQAELIAATVPSQHAEASAPARRPATIPNSTLSVDGEATTFTGGFNLVTPARVLCRMATDRETGLLVVQSGEVVKDIYLVNGAPEFVTSNVASERLGEYLVSCGVITAGELAMALAVLPRFHGRLGDTLVGLGLMKPLDVFRHLLRQVREKLVQIFAWSEGSFRYYRGRQNNQEAFPLGLDAFAIIGAGVASLPLQQVVDHLARFADRRVRRAERERPRPEQFRVGKGPEELLQRLDGQRTIAAWMRRYEAPDQFQTLCHTLYLLLESELAILD